MLVHKKQYRGGRLLKKGGLRLFADLMGGGAWQERGGCFEEGLRPQCTLCLFLESQSNLSDNFLQTYFLKSLQNLKFFLKRLLIPSNLFSTSY